LKKEYNSLLFYLLVIHFFIISGSAYAQDNKLINDALVLDIGTSNYNDLVIWSDKLGLSSKGSIDDLRSELYTYYEIPPEIKNDNNGRSIIIDSAKELDYLTDAEIDQNYIILKGEVSLEMIDSGTATSHRIKADKIVFNQSEKTISAFGNINYEISREGDIEHFYGDSLVFEIETWNGIFFEGVSKKNRLIENKDLGTSEIVPFYFAGENIYRGSGDRIELNNGRISSSRKMDPYYHLSANKIWVLGPGEWAIKDATLFVGRIPVFYFPFFFIPGDQLVFNPSIGYKNIEGYFINTTTYLLGSKSDASNDTFSFLKSDNNSTVAKKKIRKGLFLRSTDKDLDLSQWPYSNGSYLKLLVDYYSRKGFFFGLDGELQFDGIVKHLNIFTAMSFSKYLYQDLDLNSSGNLYTPFRLDDSGNYVSDFQKSYLFGQILPFRFAFDIGFDIENDWSSLNIKLPIYSDNKIRSDFLNRQEGLKWTELLNNNTENVVEEEKDLPSLLWYLNWVITPSIPSLAPFVEDLAINKFNSSLNWQSAVLTQSYSTLLSANNYIPGDLLSFYYPSTFIFPDVSGKLSGTIFNTSADNNTASRSEASKSEEDYLKEPWGNPPNVDSKVDSDSIISPEFEDNIPLKLSYSNKIFSNSLKYSIVPAFSVNSIFSTNLPTEPENINFVSDYSILTATTSSTLDYSFDVSDSILNFTNSSIFSMYYKEHFDPVEIDSVWASYLLQDKNATKFDFKDNLKLSSKPFADNSVLSESKFTYNLNTTLYNRYYESTEGSFQNKYFVWNNDSINSHEASLEIKYFDSINYQIFKLRTVLPPGNLELYPELIVFYGSLTASVKSGFIYLDMPEEDYWQYNPSEAYIKYDFFEKDYLKETAYIDSQNTTNSYSSTELYIDKFDSNLKFNQILDVNIKNNDFQKASTDLQLWFLNFNFLAEDIVGYSFLSPTGWIPDPISKFQPSKASAGINYNYNPDPLWKNRIRLSLDINSAWTMNLLKYTDTAFTFNLNFSLQIAEFLDLKFESKSVNRASYRYLPVYSDQLGLTGLNIFSDLFKSFNFFNKNDRLESNFNIEYLNIIAVHHLSDWDLSVKYSGQPVLITNTDNSKEYRMQSEFSVFVSWKPVPEIKKNINYSDKTISFE